MPLDCHSQRNSEEWPGSTCSEAHRVDVETRLRLGIAGPSSSSPGTQSPWRAVATRGTHSTVAALARPAVVTAAVPVCRGIPIPTQSHGEQDLVSSSSLLGRVCGCALKGRSCSQCCQIMTHFSWRLEGAGGAGVGTARELLTASAAEKSGNEPRLCLGAALGRSARLCVGQRLPRGSGIQAQAQL